MIYEMIYFDLMYRGLMIYNFWWQRDFDNYQYMVQYKLYKGVILENIC